MLQPALPYFNAGEAQWQSTQIPSSFLPIAFLPAFFLAFIAPLEARGRFVAVPLAQTSRFAFVATQREAEAT